ncbi:hypothetical protein BR93DRAFT_148235 [Coniochaeta sp. PMI_546]|nr:hypothetical protein BR93DRAFT_148235 [Coniochaeta sp. PMI_546]
MSKCSIFTCFLTRFKLLRSQAQVLFCCLIGHTVGATLGRAVGGSRLERQPSSITAQLAIVICQNRIYNHQPAGSAEITSFGCKLPRGSSVLAPRLNCHFEQEGYQLRFGTYRYHHVMGQLGPPFASVEGILLRSK